MKILELPPQHPAAGEGLPDLVEAMAGAPSAEQGGDHVARLVAPFFGVEIDPHHRSDHRQPLGQPSRLAQRAPLPRGQRDYHDAPPIGGREIATKAAVKIVADRWPRMSVDLDVADIAKVADRRE